LSELFDVSCAKTHIKKFDVSFWNSQENQSFLAVSPNFLVAWKPYKTQQSLRSWFNFAESVGLLNIVQNLQLLQVIPSFRKVTLIWTAVDDN